MADDLPPLLDPDTGRPVVFTADPHVCDHEYVDVILLTDWTVCTACGCAFLNWPSLTA